MANEIYRVELDEQTFRLGESGNINLSDWEAVFGSKLINLVDGFLEKSGREPPWSRAIAGALAKIEVAANAKIAIFSLSFSLVSYFHMHRAGFCAWYR